MALPVSISGDLSQASPPMKAPNGAIYLVVGDSTSAEVWKLSDPDTGSWAEQDSTNKPTAANASSVAYMHACQYEHLIFVAYGVLNGSEHDIVETTFNTATDSWEGSNRTVYSGGPGEIPTGWLPCALVATPNYLYCLHPCDDEKVKGIHRDRCMVSYRDLDGTTWNNSTQIGAGLESHIEPHALAVNESENAVAIYWQSSSEYLYAAAWNRSSFGSAANTASVIDDRSPLGQAVSYMDGSTNRIIVRDDGAGATSVWRLTSTGTTVTSVAHKVIETMTSKGDRGGIARWGTTLYAWYVNSSDNPAYEDSTDHGASWSGAQHSNPSNNVTEHPWANCYTRKGALKIGIVYKEGTTQLSYDERSISNVSAPGFASARTPVRQNRIFVDA